MESVRIGFDDGYEWDDDSPLSEEFIANLKRDAPNGCILCDLDGMDEE